MALTGRLSSVSQTALAGAELAVMALCVQLQVRTWVWCCSGVTPDATVLSFVLLQEFAGPEGYQELTWLLPCLCLCQ